MKRLITLVLLALAMTACGPTDAPAQPTREELSRQSDRLAMAMLSWELQTGADRKTVCVKARTRGQDGTRRAWAAQQGGSAGDWSAATSWLLETCEKAGY